MNPARYGRNGDSLLVHMRPDELQGLGLLAQAVGSNLTTNPQTGYPEAWKMPKWVLPAAAIAATALTAGAAAPAAAGALGAAGAGTAAAGTAGALGAGTAAAGAGAAGTGGLLAAEGASLGAGGAGLGMGSAQLGTSGLLGMGSAASGTAATETAGAMMGAGSLSPAAASVGAQPGLWGQVMAGADKYGKPINAAMTAAQNAQGPEEPPIQAQPLQRTPLDLSGIIQQGEQAQQFDAQENERRRKLMQAYANYGMRM